MLTKEDLRIYMDEALTKLGVSKENISKFLDNPDTVKLKHIGICFAITDYIENIINEHLSDPICILQFDTFNKLYDDYINNR